MNLHDYLAQKRGRQAALAKAIGAYAPDISRWADGTRPIPFPFGAPIEKATQGLVTRKEMFPDDWERLWPELVNEPAPRRATDPAPAPGHAGRQSPTTNGILDTVPDRAAVGIDARAI